MHQLQSRSDICLAGNTTKCNTKKHITYLHPQLLQFHSCKDYCELDPKLRKTTILPLETLVVILT